MTAGTLSYTAQVQLTNGQLFTYTGSQRLLDTTTASLQSAASAMGSDISSQMVNGMPQDASIANQVATDSNSS